MRKYAIILGLLSLAACSDNTPDNPGENQEEIVSVEKSVTIDAGQAFQTMVGFGASDCWTPAYIGKYWTNSRDRIAELLFSSEIVDGQPKGIGLSMWRVNLGGGSAEQGDDSGIVDKSRRAESYLTDNFSLDWTRCEGQRYFMDRAKEFGIDNFVLFSNTPPVQYTLNGKGFSQNGGSANLKSDCYDDFAAYMAEVAKHYVDEGYPVSHVSPVNEPQYNWDGNGQEGSGWKNEEVAKLARELDDQLTQKGLPTNILLGESGDWEYLYKVKDDANRSNVLSAFFSSSSPAYVGNLSHMEKLICGHSYWTDGTWDGMRDVRKKLAQTAEQYGVDVWQSEWSMLGDNYSSSEFVGYDAASEMDIALYMSKVIHNDLTVANVTSWNYWVAMDVSRWGQKNRFLLVALTPKGWAGDKESIDNLEEEGSFNATSTLWVLGNYSRFIRPGYHRISMTLNESMSFFGSAWMSPQKDCIVAVYTNLSSKGIRLNETRQNWGGEPKTIKTYTTSAGKQLVEKVLQEGDSVVLDAESVTTVVYELK